MPSIDKLYLNELINRAIKENAASIFLNVSTYPIIKIRDNLKSIQDGQILTKDFLDTVATSLLTKEQSDTLEKEKEMTIAYDWSNEVRLLVNLFYQKDSLAISIKIISSRLPDVQELSLPKIVNDIFQLNSGLVIICGPVSSGRTTTILSILDYINKNENKRIVTLENPIEYQFINNKSIFHQREIGRDVNSLVDGLKDVIDEDVDIVYVSRIVKKEDIKEVLRVSNSGKLVLAVIDSDSIVSVLDQIYGSFDLSEKDWGKSLLVESLQIIINQRLLPKIGGDQILVPEVFKMTSASSATIKSGNFDQIKSIMQTSKQDNMQDLDSVLKRLVQNGSIELSVAKKYADSPERF